MSTVRFLVVIDSACNTIFLGGNEIDATLIWRTRILIFCSVSTVNLLRKTVTELLQKCIPSRGHKTDGTCIYIYTYVREKAEDLHLQAVLRRREREHVIATCRAIPTRRAKTGEHSTIALKPILKERG